MILLNNGIKIILIKNNSKNINSFYKPKSIN